MPSGVNLKLTSHAVERWRERVNPDEGPSHIALAFVGAMLVPKGDPLPFPRTPHTTFYRHATLADIYFVTQACNQGSGAAVLVTVIDASELWGVKRAFVPPVEVPPVEVVPEPPAAWSEPEHADAEARRTWLVAEWERTCAAQARCGDLGRKHPVRQAWNERRAMMASLLAGHKKEMVQAAQFLERLREHQRNHTSTAQ